MFNQAALYLLLLLLPGIVSLKIYYFITNPWKKNTEFEFILHSYLLSAFLYGIIQIFYPNLNFLQDLMTLNQNLSGDHLNNILIATILGLFIGIALAILNKKLFFYRLFRKLNITNVASEKTVFQDLYEYNLINNCWCTIRILNQKVHFICYIEKYKLYDSTIELFLQNVTVYPETESKYDTTSLYLHQPFSNIYIEFLKTD